MKNMKLNRLLLFGAIIIFCLAISPVFAVEKFDDKDFSNFVKKEMKIWNVPGSAIIIIKDDKVIFSEGFGYRDAEKKLKVTPKTIFAIGSSTKAFTTLVAGMLVDEKKVEWDRPIRDYYPGLKMYDKYVAEHLTLRDALCHRSGLPRHDIVWWVNSGLSRKEIMDRLQYLKPSYGFREIMQYNNHMYVLSGYVVEKITGKSWEESVRERIFKPLGMNDSCFEIADVMKSNNYALPYHLQPKKPEQMPEKPADVPIKQIPFCKDLVSIGPAGSINSNIEDMGKWVKLHLNRGKVSDKQIIREDTLLDMHTPQMAMPVKGEFEPVIFKEMPVLNYGLGWVIQPYRGNYLVHHGGNVDGFSALVSFIPEKKIGIVVLTNMTRTTLPYIITFSAYDRLIGLDRIDWNKKFMDKKAELLGKSKESMEKEHKKNTSPSHPITDYMGKYTNKAYGDIIITLKDKNLNITFRNKTGHLKHYQYDTFKPEMQFPVYYFNAGVTFGMNKKGNIDKLSIPLEPAVDDIVFERVSDG
ncbi:MAG: serine hydrolase [Candidatus Eremiobacteraeota bacterium]|nr:serine hydrolase [Candidatus Eremiobacteraeota bacterium]